MTDKILNRTHRPKVHQFGELTISPEQVIEGDNGVTIHYINNGDQPIVRVTILWNRGSADTKLGAIATFIPSMMKDGTPEMSGKDIADLLDYEGSWFKIRKSTHYCGIELLCLAQSLPRLTKVLGQMVTVPTLPEPTFVALKQKAISARKVHMKRVASLSQKALELLIAGKKHPYSRYADDKTYSTIELSQVRQGIEQIKDAKIHIFVGGKIDDKIRAEIETLSQAIRPTQVLETQSVFKPYSAEKPGIYFIPVPDSLQSSVSIGIPTIGRDNPDYIPLRIVVTALGGYFGSRLMTNIREEKGLTYGITAALNGTFEGGYVSINAQCDAKYTAEVLSETAKEIEKLSSEPMGDDELNRLKQYLSTTLAATLDSPLAITDYYLNRLLVGTPNGYFESHFKTLKDIDGETIMATAHRYLNIAEARIVVAGPIAPNGSEQFDFEEYR